MCRPVRNPGSLGDRDQRLILFEVWLEQPEALHGQLACPFQERGQFVHTGPVCQIKLTTICQLILKATVISPILGGSR